MYNNMTTNIAIDYDPDIVSKIREMIEAGFDKLKSFVKSKTDEITEISNLNFYNELNLQFREISMKLKELKLCTEHYYFTSIKDYVLYIVHQNSIDSTFDHCNFALELLDFFMELFKTNLKFYKTKSKCPAEFKRSQKKFKERYWDYRCLFYSDIYQPSGDFTEEELYKIHEHLKG